MSNSENHNPQVIRQISKEVKNLSNENLEGIQISVNESNLTDIQAVIDGPGESRLCSEERIFLKFMNDIDPVFKYAFFARPLCLHLLFSRSWNPIQWRRFSYSLDTSERFSHQSSKSIFPHKNFPSKRRT